MGIAVADELLSAVIRLENRIQQQLQQEQARADTWLAGVRAEQEEHASQIRQELADEDERILAAAGQQDEQEAEALVACEKQYCRRLEQISDQVLLEVLRRQLLRILPGQVDDHQDVQS